MKTNEIKIGETINSRKCYQAFRGHLQTANGGPTDFIVYSIGRGVIQLAAAEVWTGRIKHVSAPMPASSVKKAGKTPWFGGQFLQYWKPA